MIIARYKTNYKIDLSNERFDRIDLPEFKDYFENCSHYRFLKTNYYIFLFSSSLDDFSVAYHDDGYIIINVRFCSEIVFEKLLEIAENFKAQILYDKDKIIPQYKILSAKKRFAKMPDGYNIKFQKQSFLAHRWVAIRSDYLTVKEFFNINPKLITWEDGQKNFPFFKIVIFHFRGWTFLSGNVNKILKLGSAEDINELINKLVEYSLTFGDIQFYEFSTKPLYNSKFIRAKSGSLYYGESYLAEEYDRKFGIKPREIYELYIKSSYHVSAIWSYNLDSICYYPESKEMEIWEVDTKMIQQ